jgi:secreted trypsin-like serine protease
LGSSKAALVASGAVLVLLLAAAGPAGAIFNGGPDGNGHPNVGALLAAQAYSDGTWAFCTGTLVAANVVLTAAHCQDDLDGDRVAVTFDSAWHADTGTAHWGTFHADPRYRPAQNDPYDLAVVVLDNSIGSITPADLPAAGSLAHVAPGTKFTAVGYGAQFITHKQGGQVFHYTDVRFVAVSTFRTQTRTWLRNSQNVALGNGGTCTGDSGGPNFLGAGSGETNILAATTITGDSACHSTNVDYRLDTASARQFLGQYVSLP